MQPLRERVTRDQDETKPSETYEISVLKQHGHKPVAGETACTHYANVGKDANAENHLSERKGARLFAGVSAL